MTSSLNEKVSGSFNVVWMMLDRDHYTTKYTNAQVKP